MTANGTHLTYAEMTRVVDYLTCGPRRFAVLRGDDGTALAQAGVAVVVIEYVGSTSVPDLGATPVI